MGLLYTNLKVFHYQEKLDSLGRDVDAILPPLHIRIKPTNMCNHNCWYCAYRAEDLQLGKDMAEKDYIPREKMLEIIDDLVDMKVRAVTFSGGGEPFCYPYIVDVAKRLSQADIKFAALTNGARLQGEAAKLFAEHATWLRVSIDGYDDASYSRYRSVKEGEFTKVIDNMRNFKKLGGGCYLGVSLVVDKDNAEHVYDFVSQLKDVGVDSVKVSACIVSNDAAENNRYHQPMFEQTKALVAKAIDELADDRLEIFDAYHRLEENFAKDYNWCPFLQILPIIGADLNIYSCQDKAYNLDEGLIGSIKEQSFKQFWFADKEKFFKIDPSEHCSHHCVANSKNMLIMNYLGADSEHLGFV